MRSRSAGKIVVMICLLLLVVLLQYEYDATSVPLANTGSQGLSPFMIRAIDMGFDSTAASFMWVTTMPEILDLFAGKTEYFSDLAAVNAVDPKLSYPYAFSVLTLPIVPKSGYPDALSQSFVIGQEGLENADPDWRIPYYMAINYYLGEKDLKDAVTYFNLAADTPGVPQYAERFALNFGIGQNDRDRVRDLWETVYESTNDPDEKARAAAYITRLNIFDYLDAASAQYKKEFGVYPTSTAELVTKGIISSVPVDPFGFTFIIKPNGTSDIDLTQLPAYISSEPAE